MGDPPDPSCDGIARSTRHPRLVGGGSAVAGLLKLCNTGGYRRQVCDDGWDGKDAEVVCRELGFLQDGIGVLIFTQSVPACIYL